MHACMLSVCMYLYLCNVCCVHIHGGISTCLYNPHVTCLGSLFAQALKTQMDQLQKRVMKDCVSKPALDGQINDVTKRLADVEW